MEVGALINPIFLRLVKSFQGRPYQKELTLHPWVTLKEDSGRQSQDLPTPHGLKLLQI